MSAPASSWMILTQILSSTVPHGLNPPFLSSLSFPQFYPSFSFHCPSPVDGSITPFGDMYLLSIGFVLTAIVCLPLGFWNLDDNIKVQKVSCLAVSGMVFVWVGLFIGHWGLDASRVPAIGTQMSQVLGVVVFNFAVISSIPSWVNEKKEGVSILRTLGYSVGLALGLFTLIGIFGGMAFAPWFNSSDSDQTLLNKLQDSSSALAKFTFYFFPIVVDLTSIPVFAIMQRYNLLEAKVCSKGWANFIGVVLPWLVCIPFYTGSGFSEIINWGGIIFNSSINFVIPPLIYIAMVRKQTQRHQIATQRVHMSALTSSAGSPAREPIDEYAYGNEDSESAHAFVAPAPLKITVTRPSIVNGGRGDGSSVVGSMLGARSHNAVGASLKQSLLGGGDEFGGGSSAFGGSGAYHPSEVDVRSAEEEQKDEELLGYDPVEAERQEAEELEREIARRQSVAASRPHSPSMLTGSLTAAAASSSIFGRSRSPTTAAPSVTANLLTVPASDDSVVDLADDLDLLSLPFVQGWNAMPKWVIPYRVHLAAGVATLLVILSLIVIGVNIDQCVTQGC